MPWDYEDRPLGHQLSAQAALLQALVVRGIVTRFAGGIRGYFWVIVTPVSWILAIALFFVLIGRSAPIKVNLPIFIATGMLPYLIFRQTITAVLRAEAYFRHILIARIATPRDVFTATALLELINSVFLVVVVMGFIGFIFEVPAPQNLLHFALALTTAWALGLAVGGLILSLARFIPDIVRLAPILLRPFFWISGIFFLAQEIPLFISNWLWWNPLLHIVELSRSGFLYNFNTEYGAWSVPAAATLILGILAHGLSQNIRPTQEPSF